MYVDLCSKEKVDLARRRQLGARIDAVDGFLFTVQRFVQALRADNRNNFNPVRKKLQEEGFSAGYPSVQDESHDRYWKRWRELMDEEMKLKDERELQYLSLYFAILALTIAFFSIYSITAWISLLYLIFYGGFVILARVLIT